MKWKLATSVSIGCVTKCRIIQAKICEFKMNKVNSNNIKGFKWTVSKVRRRRKKYIARWKESLEKYANEVWVLQIFGFLWMLNCVDNLSKPEKNIEYKERTQETSSVWFREAKKKKKIWRKFYLKSACRMIVVDSVVMISKFNFILWKVLNTVKLLFVCAWFFHTLTRRPQINHSMCTCALNL